MQVVLFYGKLNERVEAKLVNTGDPDTSYVAEATFEETGDYLNEDEVLLLERQNDLLIRDLCS